MVTDRAEVAAARVRSAQRRAAELRERIERLSAGVPPTRTDVAVARARAVDQRNEALRAQERLTYAGAGRANRPQLDGCSPAGYPEAETQPRPSTEARTLEQLRRERGLLRSAFIALVAPGGIGGDTRASDDRQRVWQAILDQCGEEDWFGWAHALCAASVSLLPGLRGAAVSGYDQQQVPYLLGVSDEWTRQVEEIHRVVGEGPAVEAYASGYSIVVTDLADEQARWPGYVAVAAGSGACSLWALPVKMNGFAVGSLSLYWPEPVEPWGKLWLDAALLASAATPVLQAELNASEEGLGGELGDDSIAIATGMVVEQLTVTVDEALARMRAFAFSNAWGLTQVADAIVDGSLRLP